MKCCRSEAEYTNTKQIKKYELNMEFKWDYCQSQIKNKKINK